MTILSSKLFQASTNKSRIIQAMNDPVNAQLMQQLNSYLDEEYRHPSNNADDVPSDTSQDIPSESSEPGPDSAPASEFQPSGAAPHGSSTKFTDDFVDSFADAPADSVDDLPESEASEENDKDSSTSDTITEAVDILDDASNIDTLNENLDKVRSFLESNSATSGVSNIRIKNNELWVYYKDNINLNNIMEDVINYLNDSEYNYLSFNRLARTDNAIVFEIQE